MKASLIIIAYKSRSEIQTCLSSVRAQTQQPDEITLVENGSPVGQRVLADDVPEGVNYIENSENLGFAVANNRAAEGVTSDWLVFLNPDAFAEPDWLEKLKKASEKYPDADIFGSTQIDAGNPDMLDGAGDVYHMAGIPYRGGYGRPVSEIPEDGDVFAACGAALMIRRELFEKLGGFDESFFCYCEDVDLCFRARLLGARVMQVRDAVVRHVGSASSGVSSAFAVFHGTRNRMWTFFKNMPGLAMWLLLPLHLALTGYQFIGAIRRKVMKAYIKGYWQGLTGLPGLMKERGRIQTERRIGFWVLFKDMLVNPMTLIQRKPFVRPLRKSNE